MELISDRWFAYVGAVVTVISLAFGTFVQQLLAYENLPITDPALLPGNIPRSDTWQHWTGNPAEGGL
jgi:Na+/citrate or Na+/malate symporter